MLARLHVGKNELIAAEAELRALLERQPDVARGALATRIDGLLGRYADPQLGALARVRLARVLFALGRSDDALAVLDAAGTDDFAVEKLELRGDILSRRNDTAAAITAYRAAVERAGSREGATASRLLQLKLQELELGEPVAGAAPAAADPAAADATPAPDTGATQAMMIGEKKRLGPTLLRALLAASLAGMLGACGMVDYVKSIGDDEEDAALAPAELVEFSPEVDIRKVWSTGVGNGQGKLYNRLQPALYGDAIFAAAQDGTVVALDAASGKRRWKVDVDTELSGGVGVGGDLVLVGNTRGRVIAMESASGTRTVAREREQRGAGSARGGLGRGRGADARRQGDGL